MIKLSAATFGNEEKEALCGVIDHGYVGMGIETRQFEAELKTFIDPNEPPALACVGTGTFALHLAVQALGIGAGDEVLVPTITYLASFQAVSATGAIPIPCDVDLFNGCIDVADAAKRITPRTKAIMTVHYASGYGDLDGVYTLAQKHGLRVIEDAAHSFGGFYKGKRVGATGDVVCLSFDNIKNLTCGEGGAVVSRDEAVISRVMDLRLLAIEKDSEQRYKGKRSFDFEVKEQGWRYHMSNLNAALGRAQLKKIDQFGERRRHLFKLYQQCIPTSIARAIQIDLDNCIPHPYIVILENCDKEKRDDLMAYLKTHDIETGLHYKPNHLLTYFKDLAAPMPAGFPNAEDLWSRMITLPLHCNLSDEDVRFVSEKLVGFFK